MTEFVTNYFNIIDTGEQFSPEPIPGLTHSVGDYVYLDKFRKGTWIKIVRKRMTIYNIKHANIYWDAEITTKP